MKIGKGIVAGPSLDAMRNALGLLALGNEAFVYMEFSIEGSQESGGTKTRTYPICGFKRYEGGENGPWALICPSHGVNEPDDGTTSLHFYPVTGTGHTELMGDD